MPGPTRRAVVDGLLRGCATGVAGVACAMALPRRARAGDIVVELATLDWAPYVGPSLPEHGWVAQVVREAFQHTGHRPSLHFLPWARAVRDTMAGAFDGVFPTYITRARERDLAFASDLPAARVGLWARVEQVRRFAHRELTSLSGLRVGVVRGYVNHDEIDDPSGSWTRDEARSNLLNLRKLIAGRVDLVVVDHLVARHILAQNPHMVGTIAPVPPAFGRRPTSVGFNRRTSRGLALRDALNQGLAELRTSGRLHEIVEQHRLRGMLVPSVDPSRTLPADPDSLATAP